MEVKPSMGKKRDKLLFEGNLVRLGYGRSSVLARVVAHKDGDRFCIVELVEHKGALLPYPVKDAQEVNQEQCPGRWLTPDDYYYRNGPFAISLRRAPAVCDESQGEAKEAEPRRWSGYISYPTGGEPVYGLGTDPERAVEVAHQALQGKIEADESYKERSRQRAVEHFRWLAEQQRLAGAWADEPSNQDLSENENAVLSRLYDCRPMLGEQAAQIMEKWTFGWSEHIYKKNWSQRVSLALLARDVFKGPLLALTPSERDLCSQALELIGQELPIKPEPPPEYKPFSPDVAGFG